MKTMRLFLLVIILVLVTGCGDTKVKEDVLESEPVIGEVKKISIIDLDSDSRPYAVVINNFPSATKVQSGLQEAYMIYEFPIEGGLTRSLALFKDKNDVKIGTIRSARHDYLDYVLENDAIFVHFGWSVPAKNDIFSLGINYIDGNSSDPSPFWRENPELLATEHTVYTNLSKVIDYNKTKKKYRETTDISTVLNYTTDDVKFDTYEDAKSINNIEISYSRAFKIGFNYNTETLRYDRTINGEEHIDYFTKKQYDTKNIIITFLDWGYTECCKDSAGNNYLDLYNTGTGSGYYITNGYAREINWSKTDRNSQTKYTYLDGTEIDVNDGNTWIVFSKKEQLVKFS